MNDFATVGGICVGVTGSGRAAFYYHCAFGQQQLSPTAEKQHTLARWQFVAGWRLVCDLLVCLMCLSTVGPCWMLATVPIMLRWRVCFNWTQWRFWNIPSLSIWGNQFSSCGEVFFEDIYGFFHEAISLCVSVWEHKTRFCKGKYKARLISSCPEGYWAGFNPHRTQIVDEIWKVW